MSEYLASDQQSARMPEPRIIVSRMGGLIRHWNDHASTTRPARPNVFNMDADNPRAKVETAAIGFRRIPPLGEYRGTAAEAEIYAPVFVLGSLIISRTIQSDRTVYQVAETAEASLRETSGIILRHFHDQSKPGIRHASQPAPYVSLLEIQVAAQLAAGLEADDRYIDAALPARSARDILEYYHSVQFDEGA